MRIDGNQGAQPGALAESNRAASQNPASGGTGSTASNALGDALGEDQAQLSGAHIQVEALAAQALQFPEIRHEKVNALRQAVSDGSYQVGSEQVADAVFAHMLAKPAA